VENRKSLSKSHSRLVSQTISVADPDPHHFGKLDLDPDPHQSGKLDPDPGPHQSEKMEALEGHFGALEGPYLEKSEWLDPDPDQTIR
jgi:hypothetical protein